MSEKKNTIEELKDELFTLPATQWRQSARKK